MKLMTIVICVYLISFILVSIVYFDMPKEDFHPNIDFSNYPNLINNSIPCCLFYEVLNES
jgi:hypothetical protein